MNERSIRFDHLHIILPNVGDHIRVFGFDIMFYGMIIACGMLIGGLFVLREGKKQGFTDDDLLDIIMGVIVFGILGARIYYVLFSLSSYQGRWLSVFNIREGGLAIYGGLIGSVLSTVVLCQKKGLSFLAVADVCVFGGIIGQIFGRWGNFFNREAFGGYSDGLLSMQLPTTAVRQPDAITEEMLAHANVQDGLTWISVHPTFLYESLWNVGVFLILYFFVRPRKQWDGEIFVSYLLLYGMGRFWIEGLRTDQLLVFGTTLPVSRCLAAACVVCSVAILTYQRRKQSW